MAAHHLADCGEVRGTAGAGGEDLADFLEVGRHEHSRGRNRQECRVDVPLVLKTVDLSALHADRLAGSDLEGLTVYVQVVVPSSP